MAVEDDRPEWNGIGQRRFRAAARNKLRKQVATKRAKVEKARKWQLHHRFLREMNGHPSLDDPDEVHVLFDNWLERRGLCVDED